MRETRNIGLWGCGTMGRSLAQALIATGRARLAVAYDLVTESATRLADMCGGKIANSASALLAHPGLEGVIIALPPYLHAEAVARAAGAGLDIFVEKPMAVHAADCRGMIDAARQQGVKLMVGQVLRYYEPYRSILRWQSEGRFGRIYAASIWRIVDGSRWNVDGYWRASRAKSGGFLLEISAHELDMLRCLMGSPQTVYALSQKVLPAQHEMEDYISVQIRFAGGGVACYEGGGGTRVGRYGFRLYFEGATLVSEAAFDPQALQIHLAEPEGEPAPDEFSDQDPVQAELGEWLDALEGVRSIPIPGEEGLATVVLAEAAYRSADTGQVVTLSSPQT